MGSPEDQVAPSAGQSRPSPTPGPLEVLVASLVRDIATVAGRLLTHDLPRAATTLARELPRAARQTLEEGARHLSDAYDGEPGYILFGTPEQARAWRALLLDDDPEHFLRVFGAAANRGESGLAKRALGTSEPLEAFVEEVQRRTAMRGGDQVKPLTGAPGERDDDPPYLDWLTIPELEAWAEAWVAAVATVEQYMEEREARDEMVALSRGAPSSVSRDLRELEAADLLLLAAAEAGPRGFAAGDPQLHQRMQTLRKRIRRHQDQERQRANRALVSE